MAKPKPPLYAQWIVDDAPCWKCDARVGEQCKTLFGPYAGQPVRPHTTRGMTASVLRDPDHYNWKECTVPTVTEHKARKEHSDDCPGNSPIQPRDTYYKWKPHGVKQKRSTTRPTLQNGVLFWPPENPNV